MICKCENKKTNGADFNGDANNKVGLKLLIIILGIAVWTFIYRELVNIASFIAFKVLGFMPGSRIGEAVYFFLYDTPKVLMLLILIVFAVGILRSFFTPERTRAVLSGKLKFIGNILAALLGTVTPFCSCSAVPLFIGFIEAGVPLGVTFSFLISAPMVNEVAVALLFTLIGWKVALIYTLTGLFIAIIAGWIIGQMRLEKFVEPWVYDIKIDPNIKESKKLSWSGRIDYGWVCIKDIVGKIWPYVLLGIAVGAFIHGYVPERLMAKILGKNNWWSVPAAVVVGVPMYSNAAGIMPVVEALLEKGAALGSVLAFMMAVIALSLPEAIILRKVLKPQLIAVFFGVVAFGILLVGYMFNILF